MAAHDLATRMVQEQLRSRGLRNEAVLWAMEEVPRHRFVPNIDPAQAYDDLALPTSDGQTISQPYIVALMTELAQIQVGLRVLEIGTGSGYQTAVLAHLGAHVVSIERSIILAERARHALAMLGYGDSVEIIVADGSLGWPAGVPYDRIIATAAAPHLPEAYRTQLADGGRIVIPLGDRRSQHLMVFQRFGDQWTESVNSGCRFVPLIGHDAWPD